MSNNKQQPRPENPNNQFSNTEPLTHAQKVAIANTISNNKQSMKLYTEEQVIDMLSGFIGKGNADDYLNRYYTPIELPSDEYIEKYFTHDLIFGVYRVDYNKVEGAKWMRDKIGGNK